MHWNHTLNRKTRGAKENQRRISKVSQWKDGYEDATQCNAIGTRTTETSDWQATKWTKWDCLQGIDCSY